MAKEETTVDFVKAIAKELYGDALSPAAREIGLAVGDLLHTMRLAGFEFGAFGRERIVRLIGRSMAAIPSGERIQPPPQIVGPILEGSKYEPEGTPIYEMFEALLASSMDRRKMGEVHPAFIRIVGVLSPDEARLVRHLTNGPMHGGWNDPDTPYDQATQVYPPQGLLERPDEIGMYVAHLDVLGLARGSTEHDDVDEGTRGFGRFRLTLEMMPFGNFFMKACTRPER